MFNTEDFKNDYYNYLSIDEMKLKYGISNSTYFTILKKLGLKRPIASKINKLIHMNINKDKPIESKIEKFLDKPIESKTKTTNNNITSFGNVESLCKQEDIKPVYHKPIVESNIEVIKKPTIKIDRRNKEKNDILDELLNSVNDTINNANKKKKKNKIINNK